MPLRGSVQSFVHTLLPRSVEVCVCVCAHLPQDPLLLTFALHRFFFCLFFCVFIVLFIHDAEIDAFLNASTSEIVPMQVSDSIPLLPCSDTGAVKMLP